MRYFATLMFSGMGLLLASCQAERPQPKVPDDASQIHKATDLFWALQELGFIAAKQKPPKSNSGCKPTEYLVAKDSNKFRISVFECATSKKAKEVVEHTHTRKIDDLLRNRHEGGVLRRNKLEIILRRLEGDAEATDKLLEDLGAL
ncbi:MAG: hypothetical protein JRF33_24450 [Deltaproteobacteria bacterium]|nr:hypothetical protein [Deltaproteobacteria bacterium]